MQMFPEVKYGDTTYPLENARDQMGCSPSREEEWGSGWKEGNTYLPGPSQHRGDNHEYWCFPSGWESGRGVSVSFCEDLKSSMWWMACVSNSLGLKESCLQVCLLQPKSSEHHLYFGSWSPGGRKKLAIRQNWPPRFSPPKGTEWTVLNKAPIPRKATMEFGLLNCTEKYFPGWCGFAAHG